MKAFSSNMSTKNNLKVLKKKDLNKNTIFKLFENSYNKPKMFKYTLNENNCKGNTHIRNNIYKSIFENLKLQQGPNSRRKIKKTLKKHDLLEIDYNKLYKMILNKYTPFVIVVKEIEYNGSSLEYYQKKSGIYYKRDSKLYFKDVKLGFVSIFKSLRQNHIILYDKNNYDFMISDNDVKLYIVPNKYFES